MVSRTSCIEDSPHCVSYHASQTLYPLGQLFIGFLFLRNLHWSCSLFQSDIYSTFHLLLHKTKVLWGCPRSKLKTWISLGKLLQMWWKLSQKVTCPKSHSCWRAERSSPRCLSLSLLSCVPFITWYYSQNRGIRKEKGLSCDSSSFFLFFHTDLLNTGYWGKVMFW